MPSIGPSVNAGVVAKGQAMIDLFSGRPSKRSPSIGALPSPTDEQRRPSLCGGVAILPNDLSCHRSVAPSSGVHRRGSTRRRSRLREGRERADQGRIPV